MKIRTCIAVNACALLLSLSAMAQEAKPPAPSAEELGKKLSNPVADLVSLPLQMNFMEGVGPYNDLAFDMKFQPVVPFHITKNWNMIGRMILPYVNQPVLTTGGTTASGTGDIVASAFFSPKKEDDGVTWGVGPVFNLPTTTNPALGSGQWGIGPTFVVLRQKGHMTYGILANQLWGFADTGNYARTGLNAMYLQPFFSYTTPAAVTYSVNSETTANWTASSSQTWSVPINFVISKVTKLGPFPFQVGGGAGYYVESPDNGPTWQLRAQFTVILP